MRDDLDLFARIAKHGFVDMEYIYRFTYKGRKKGRSMIGYVSSITINI